MSSRPTSPERPFATVAVLGLGAMGGSLARALRGLGSAPTVVGWSPLEDERVAATREGAVSSAPPEWQEAVSGADLVVVAAPLQATCSLMAGLAHLTSSETTISDVASLKAPVERAVEDAGARARWVGSHPMTGSQESGFSASRADLYRGARVWTVAHADAQPRVARLHAFWETLEARPAAIDADDHDRLMAVASHLPQLMANVLASVMAQHDVSPDSLGPGGTDMTRLSASGSEMWRDILEHASPVLTSGLRDLSDEARRVADLLDAGDLAAIEDLMKRTKIWKTDA